MAPVTPIAFSRDVRRHLTTMARMKIALNQKPVIARS
jgi:hypothetical protein